MKHYFLLLFLLFFPALLFATVVKGKVTNEKGESLGFAAVFIKGTQNGVMADEQGNYSLSLAPGDYTLICRITAFKSVEKKVKIEGSNLEVNFRLQSEKLKIKEVTIHANAEDPAYAIMRKVIERRKYHENLIQTRETDIYLKGNLKVEKLPDIFKTADISVNESNMAQLGLDSSGSGIIYLLEEVSHYTYQAPDKEFNKVVSVRESGNPQGLGFASMPPILNIYQNNVNVLGLNSRGFISPANNGAFHYYRFKYLGSFEQYGKTIDKIQVTPRRAYEPCFQGYVYVAEGDWVFQNVDLMLTKTSQISGVDTVRLRQTFQPINKDLWIIQNQVLEIKLSVLGIKIGGDFLTVYQNQKINKPVDEQLFTGKVISAYDSAANKKDTSYWAAIRPVPIKKAEQKNFHLRDSVYQVEKIKSDSLKQIPHFHFGIMDFLAGNPGVVFKNNEWRMRPLATALQFNPVEGLSATLDLNWNHSFRNDTSKQMNLQWLSRYGFQNHHFNSLIHWGMKYDDPSWQQRNFSWNFTIGQYVYPINGLNIVPPIMNELYTLLAGKNYLKLYEKRLVNVSVNRNWGNGFDAGLSLGYEQRDALENSTDYTFRDHHDPEITSNIPEGKFMMPEQNAMIAKLKINYQPGFHYIQYPDYKMPVVGDNPVFSLDYTQGIPVANASADFAKWKLSLTHHLRLRMAGRLDYKIAAGGFLWKKEVNLPDWNHLSGNQTFLAGEYLSSFQLAPYYRFSNIAGFYGEGHVEWHLDGLFTNKIPLFRTLNWFLVTGSNALYIGQKDYYAEVFAGIENIGWGFFRFGRIDFIAGYESGKPRPLLGFRVSFSGIFHALLGSRSIKNL